MTIRAKQMVEKVGGPGFLLGVVLNNINMSQDESYYYYPRYPQQQHNKYRDQPYAKPKGQDDHHSKLTITKRRDTDLFRMLPSGPPPSPSTPHPGAGRRGRPPGRLPSRRQNSPSPLLPPPTILYTYFTNLLPFPPVPFLPPRPGASMPPARGTTTIPPPRRSTWASP